MQVEERAKSGPKTPEGKRRSSLNALKHGLRAVSPHALEKMTQEFKYSPETLHAVVVEYYHPKDDVEQELVREMSECYIRLDKSRELIKQKTARKPRRRNGKSSLPSGNTEDNTANNPPCPSGTISPNISLELLYKYEHAAELQLCRLVDAMKAKRKTERTTQS